MNLIKQAERTTRLIESTGGLNQHNFLEILGVIVGIKRVARLVILSSDYPHVAQFCSEMDLYCGHSQNKQAPIQLDATGDVFTITVDWEDPRGKYVVTIIAKTEQALQNGLLLENQGVSFREFGVLYEYPSCCIDSYADLEKREEWISAYLRRSPINEYGSIYGNRLAALFDGNTLLPEYFPCCLGCTETKNLAISYANMLKNGKLEHQLWETLVMLKVPILVRQGTLIQLLSSYRKQNRLYFDPKRVRVLSWRSRLVDQDVFWESDSVMFDSKALAFCHQNRILDVATTIPFDNRLLFFS